MGLPLERRERQVVLEAPTLLALVLEVVAAADVEDAPSRLPASRSAEPGSMYRPRIERRILVRDVRVVEPVRAGELVAQVDARAVVLLVAGELRGVPIADAGDLALLAALAGELEQ